MSFHRLSTSEARSIVETVAQLDAAIEVLSQAHRRVWLHPCGGAVDRETLKTLISAAAMAAHDAKAHAELMLMEPADREGLTDAYDTRGESFYTETRAEYED